MSTLLHQLMAEAVHLAVLHLAAVVERECFGRAGQAQRAYIARRPRLATPRGHLP